MNYKLLSLAVLALLSVTSSLGLTQPQGVYCTDIVGNKLSVEVNPPTGTANVTATVFGAKVDCPNEHYSYNSSDQHVNLPSDPSDCLNKAMLQYQVCPCPPTVVYEPTSNQLTVEGTKMGSITLKSCPSLEVD